ncbi:MAG TPA: transposase [Polyangiaceae bacterium]|nr:transposase [Polyangiaceae bacterium]
MGTQSHDRQSTRLRGYDYTRVGVYAVTICTSDRRLLFGDVFDGEMHLNELGQIVQATWEVLPTLYPHILLDEFIVMPNHVHAIIALIGFLFAEARRDTEGVMNHDAMHDPSRSVKIDRPPPGSLGDVVRGFKARASRGINRRRDTVGSAVWQRGYYDDIIEDDAHLRNARQYVRDNPRQWGSRHRWW